MFKKGHKHSEKTKRKMSKSFKGRIPWNKGKKGVQICSEETRKKMGNAQRGKITSEETKRKLSEGKRGDEKGSNWKGGITPQNKTIRHSIEYRLWREAVFARDNWVCQKSGERGGKLHPHHIHNFADYPELRFAIDNGVTLSEKEHRAFHRKYGKIKNNKEQIVEFLEIDHKAR